MNQITEKKTQYREVQVDLLLLMRHYHFFFKL